MKIKNSDTYNKYKGKIGQTAIGTLEIRTYDDGSTKYNIKSLVLDIDPSNTPSIRTALSCGYEIDEEEYLKRNMSGKILYRLDNYNYVNKKRK